jgi:hypothetical protein
VEPVGFAWTLVGRPYALPPQGPPIHAGGESRGRACHRIESGRWSACTGPRGVGSGAR